MNIRELLETFNLYYNNISSNQAPGLDHYEISKYYTKAQPIVVDSIYAEYEKSEEARRKLANLVVTAKLPVVTVSDDEKLYHEYTTVYQEPNDLRYIVNEQVKMNAKANVCVKNKVIDVQPVLHDELDDIIKNPYRFNYHRALRLDTSNGIEILTKDKQVDYYKIRYIKNPEPIVLILSNTEDSPNDYVDGVSFELTNASNGSLAPELHDRLAEVAAKLAYADYKNA